MDDLYSVALVWDPRPFTVNAAKSKTTGKTTGAQLDITVASGTLRSIMCWPIPRISQHRKES
jgi:hypothetical protein